MTTFHVRHDFNPKVAREALLLLKSAPIATEQDFLALARSYDFELGRRQSLTKVVASLRDLGLLQRSERRAPLTLTPLGQYLAEIALRDELLLAEFIHLRYCWLWTPEAGGERFSWAYQTVAGWLWEEAPTSIESDRLVATIIAEAEKRFAIKGVSFSSASILGIMYWLRALSPPCIVGDMFRRRTACAPETLLITLEALATVKGLPPGVAVRLDAETRRRACRTLLIDSETFDETIAQLEELGHLIRRTSDSGESVLLLDIPVPWLAPQRDQQ
ncbi:MAG: hypothetical protein K6356_06665 [Chloroflexus sp.]